MTAVVDFLKGIASAVQIALDFLISTLQDIVYIIQLLARFLLAIPGYFAFLPSSFVSIIVFIFTIAVIYKFLGRDN